MLDVTLLILGIPALVLLVHLSKRYNEWRKFCSTVNKIPGPKALPILGSDYVFIGVKREDIYELFLKIINENKGTLGMFRAWSGNNAEVHLTKPHQVEVILSSPKNIGKTIFYDYMKPWLGLGLLTSNGAYWREMRKMLTPTFHFSILEKSATVMSEKAAIIVEVIEKQIEANPGKMVDIFQLANRCTLDIICDSAMGTDINAQYTPNHSYSNALHSISEQMLKRALRPWLGPDFLFYRSSIGKQFSKDVETLHSFTNTVIQERKKSRAAAKSISEDQDAEDDGIGKKKHKAFLDILLDASEIAGKSLTDTQIREEVDTFMFAGHDTTAAAISWCLFNLGNNLAVQEKLHEELKDIFGDSTEPSTQKQLNELKYLQRVIKESLRLHPSAPTVSRKTVEDIVIDGYTIPKGCDIHLQIKAVHQDPDSWSEPKKFDPDRFLPENSQGRHPYAYIPFSAGPRNCIGQKFAQLELMIILTAILRKWRVRSELTAEEITIFAEVIMRPQNGINLYFTPKDAL